jgi:hypothetical protein
VQYLPVEKATPAGLSVHMCSHSCTHGQISADATRSTFPRSGRSHADERTCARRCNSATDAELPQKATATRSPWDTACCTLIWLRNLPCTVDRKHPLHLRSPPTQMCALASRHFVQRMLDIRCPVFKELNRIGAPRRDNELIVPFPNDYHRSSPLDGD